MSRYPGARVLPELLPTHPLVPLTPLPATFPMGICPLLDPQCTTLIKLWCELILLNVWGDLKVIKTQWREQPDIEYQAMLLVMATHSLLPWVFPAGAVSLWRAPTSGLYCSRVCREGSVMRSLITQINLGHVTVAFHVLFTYLRRKIRIVPHQNDRIGLAED